jgi:voltage-gated potassium channel
MSLRDELRFYFDDLETPMGKAVDIVIILLILAACITYIIGTYPVSTGIRSILESLEIIIGVSFTIEYILRMWIAVDRIKHFFDIYSLIDLLAIMPLFLAVSNLQFLRVFRIFRIFRLLRFLENRYFFFGTITDNMLIITRILFTISAIVFVCSGLTLLAEKGANPNINTFMDATYFTIVTLTTVGFGDITPKTGLGRVFTVLTISSGIIFIPWQVGLLIRRLITTANKIQVVCKKCGLKFHDPDAVHCKHCGHMIYSEYEGV